MSDPADRSIWEAIKTRKLIVQGPDRRYWGADVDWKSPGVVVVRLDTREQWLDFADRYGLQSPDSEA